MDSNHGGSVSIEGGVGAIGGNTTIGGGEADGFQSGSIILYSASVKSDEMSGIADFGTGDSEGGDSGTLRLHTGSSNTGRAGRVAIAGGGSLNGHAGEVNIRAGSGKKVDGGPVRIQSGSSDVASSGKVSCRHPLQLKLVELWHLNLVLLAMGKVASFSFRPAQLIPTRALSLFEAVLPQRVLAT